VRVRFPSNVAFVRRFLNFSCRIYEGEYNSLVRDFSPGAPGCGLDI
jgi:hypothetical protein